MRRALSFAWSFNYDSLPQEFRTISTEDRHFDGENMVLTYMDFEYCGRPAVMDIRVNIPAKTSNSACQAHMKLVQVYLGHSNLLHFFIKSMNCQRQWSESSWKANCQYKNREVHINTYHSFQKTFIQNTTNLIITYLRTAHPFAPLWSNMKCQNTEWRGQY